MEGGLAVGSFASSLLRFFASSLPQQPQQQAPQEDVLQVMRWQRVSMNMYRRMGKIARAADLALPNIVAPDAALPLQTAAAAAAAARVGILAAHAHGACSPGLAPRGARLYSATAGASQSSQHYGGGGGGAPSRAFPSYSIFGTDALLTLKPLLPTFKPAGGDGVALDRRGKLMLSFTPSVGGGEAVHSGGGGGGGNWKWQEQLTMALTVEELGLLVNQLPMHEVEICRAGSHQMQSRGVGGGEYSLAPEGEVSDAPDKVLTVTPGEGATVTFAIDFVRDGVGGQISPLEENSRHAPMEVVAQAGDFEVCKRLMEASIPQLLGWNSMMDIGVQSMITRSGGR